MDNLRPPMEYLVQHDNRLSFILTRQGLDPNPESWRNTLNHLPVRDFTDWNVIQDNFYGDDDVLFAQSSSTESREDSMPSLEMEEEEVLVPHQPYTMTEECGYNNYMNEMLSTRSLIEDLENDINERQNVQVLIFSDEENSEEVRSFYSCDDFSDEGHTPSSSASQEQIPEEFYSMPVTLENIQKQPEMVVQKLMKRMPRSLRRTVENNEKKKAGFACIKEVLIDDNYDYMLPPLPSGYKKKNQGCGWSRELRPNDKYEYGPKYGVKLLKHILLSPEATEKAKRIWLSVGTGDFDAALMAQGFKLVGKLLYDQNYYNIKHKDCETLKCARQKLALVLSGHRLQRCDFVMRRPVPCKNRALRIWLRNYKFCLKNFCGIQSDRITQYLDELKTKNQAFMQGEKDSETATSFFTQMKSGIGASLKYMKTAGTSVASVGTKIKKMQSDTITGLLNSGTKMMVDSLFQAMYDSVTESLSNGLSNIKQWLIDIKNKIQSFMSAFADSVLAVVPSDEKLKGSNTSMWAALALALFVLTTLTWWSSSLASTVLMSIMAFCLKGVGVEIDRKSSKDFVEAVYCEEAVMHGSSDTFGRFGKAFIGLFSLGTVGAVTNLIARMPQVKNNIKDFFMWLIDSIYSLFSKGKHYFPDFQDIDDLGVYISKCVDFLTKHTKSRIFTDDVASREMMRLGAEVPKFRRILALTTGLSNSTLNHYNSVLISIEKTSQEVRTRAWVTQARVEPTWFSMYGLPGQGKSDTYQIMPKHVYDRVSAALPDLYPRAFHPGMVYEKASGQAFCDGYDPEAHFCFAVEELAAMADTKMRGEELGLMQKIVSRSPLPLTCANVDLKNNTFFASPFVCTTSNITDNEIASGSGLTRATTIFRRRHFHMEVIIKPGHTVPQDELLDRPDECWIYRLHHTPSIGKWIKLALRNTGVDFAALVKAGYLDFTFSEVADLMAKKIIFDYNKSKANRSFYLKNFGAHFAPPSPKKNTSSSSSSESSSSSSDCDGDFQGPDGPPNGEGFRVELRSRSSSPVTEADVLIPQEEEKSDVPEIHKVVQDYVKDCEQKKKEEELPSLISECFDTPKSNEHAKLTKVLLDVWKDKSMDSFIGGHVAGKKWWAKLDPWVKQFIQPHIARKKRDQEGFMLKIVDRIYLDPQFRLLCEYNERNKSLPLEQQTPIEIPSRLSTLYTMDVVCFALELMFQAEMQGTGSSEEDETTTTTVVPLYEEIEALEFIPEVATGKFVPLKPEFKDGNYANPRIENDNRYINWDCRRIMANKWLEAKACKDSWWDYFQQSSLYRTFFTVPDTTTYSKYTPQCINELVPYPMWHDADTLQIDKYIEYCKAEADMNLVIVSKDSTPEIDLFWNRIFGSRQQRKSLYADMLKLAIWCKTEGSLDHSAPVPSYLGHTRHILKRISPCLSRVCPAFTVFFNSICLDTPEKTGINLPEGAEQCAIVARLRYIANESEEEVYSRKAKKNRPGKLFEFVNGCTKEEFNQYVKDEVSFVKEQIPNDTLVLICFQTYQALQTFWKGTKEVGTGMFQTIGGFFYQNGYLIAAILAGLCCYILLMCGVSMLISYCLKSSASQSLARSSIKRAKMQSKNLLDADLKCKLNKQGDDEFTTLQSFSRGHYTRMAKKDKVRMQSKLEDSIDIQINNISNNMRSFVFYYDDKGREAHGLISGKRCFINKHFFSTWGQNWTHMEIRNGSEVVHALQRSEINVQIDPSNRDLAWFDLGNGFNSMTSLKRHLMSKDNYDTILGTHEIARIHRLTTNGKVMHRYALGKGAARGEHKTMKAKLPNDKPFNLHLGEHFVTTGMESKSGDCGLPYVTTTESGVVKILGLHCALANSQSVFLPIYLEDEAQKTAYMQGSSKIINQGVYIPSCVRNPTPERKQNFDGRLVSLGSLPRGDFMPTETKIEASVFQGDLTTEPIYPITVAPAMLKPMTVDVEDEITGECTPVLRQPLKQGLIKMVSAPRRLFPRWMQQLFEEQPEVAFAGFFPSTKRKFRMYTIEEAIQQLDMQASIGFDFKVEGFKSRDELWRKATDTEPAWINPILRNRVNELFVAMKAGFELKNVVSTCLKDETRDLKRVYEGKTRIFCVGSLSHLIMTIMVVGDVVFYMKENHLDTDVCIGINPHGPEWWILAEKLKRHKNFGGGDYSGFDSGIIAKFGYALYLAMKWYINSGDPLYDWYLYNVCMSSIAPIFVINGECYWSDWMNSSGGWLTGFLNSFVNSCIFNCFHWWVCQENNLGERSRLIDLICAFYGDDNLWSVCDDLKEFINMKTLGEFIWACFGMTYTTAQKGEIQSEFIEFDDLEFLCRKFKPRGTIYTAPLDRESIHGMLLWIKKSNLRLPADQLAINVEQAMMEFFHHGPEVFREEEVKIRHYCEIYNIPYTAGSYEYYEDRWGTGMMHNRA